MDGSFDYLLAHMRGERDASNAFWDAFYLEMTNFALIFALAFAGCYLVEYGVADAIFHPDEQFLQERDGMGRRHCRRRVRRIGLTPSGVGLTLNF